MKKVITLLAALLIMLLPCFIASAYPSSGSISVTMVNKANKQPMSEQKIIAVKVADCTFTEADFAFSLDPAYGSGIDLTAPEAAGTLNAAVRKNGTAGTSVVTDTDGKATFENCALGAYLIYSPKEIFAPFLAFVPMITEDGINFYVAAEPKIDIPEITPTPTEEETTVPPEEDTTTDKSSVQKKTGGKLPRTGMLQLPIPILGGLGAVMFSGGFVLYAKGKKEEE